MTESLEVLLFTDFRFSINAAPFMMCREHILSARTLRLTQMALNPVKENRTRIWVVVAPNVTLQPRMWSPTTSTTLMLGKIEGRGEEGNRG